MRNFFNIDEAVNFCKGCKFINFCEKVKSTISNNETKNLEYLELDINNNLYFNCPANRFNLSLKENTTTQNNIKNKRSKKTMSFFWILTIISIVAIIPFIIWVIKCKWDNIFPILMTMIFACCVAGFMITAIAQPIAIRKELLRQEKEREQIIYQIENLTEDNDKIKLNEWILTYNDWVNDVNTSKEIYGYLSWYNTVDMTKHTIIDLV